MMATPQENLEMTESPEGLIFLPKTIKGLRNYQLGLMLGRIARGSSLSEVEALYNAAEEEIQRRQALAIHAGHIAIVS